MIVTLENAVSLLQDPEREVIQMTPIHDGTRRIWWKFWIRKTRYFRLCKDITVMLSNGKIITIPRGFRTDLSSVPKWLWSITSPFGDFLLAALIHDYLYVYNIGTRAQADREMFIWSQAINLNPTDNEIRYWAVDKFGQKWWDS